MSTTKYTDRTQLSPREAETQALKSQGLSNQQIAEKLGLKEGTVAHHLYSIGLRKRGVEYHDRTAIQDVH
jgi:DNA-binding CsgD family transcriptional regulator